MNIPKHEADARAQQWQITVIDGCCYGRRGLQSALTSTAATAGIPLQIRSYATLSTARLGGLMPTETFPSRARSGHAGETNRPPCSLVIRLSREPQYALTQLLQLGELSRVLDVTVRLAVISPLAVEVVERLLGGLGVCQRVSFLAASTPVATLCRSLLLPAPPMRVPALAAPVFLTPSEQWTLKQSVLGVPMYRQARAAALSSKTLYNRRQGALHKLGMPHLHALLGSLHSADRGRAA